MKKFVLILTLLLISGAAVAGIFGGRSGVQSTTTTPSIIGVAVTPSSFLGGSGDGTVVGAVSVTATGGTFSGTVAIGSGGQGAAFRLSSPSPPSNLVLNGTQVAGSYAINLVPTQAGFTNSGNAFPITITGTSVTTGCSQATAFLAANPGLSTAYQDAYKTYICGLVADAVIPGTASMASSGTTPYCGNKIDALWIMATADATTANRDICGHSAYTLVPNGSPNFTATQGYLGVNGSTTVFLNTGFNPATAGGNFTQNSAHMAIWSMTNAQATGGNSGTAIGSFNGTQISQILPWYSDGNAYGAINANASTGQVGGVAVTSSSGYYAVSRTSPNLETLYKGNASIGTNAIASQSMLSLPLYILGRNTSGAGDAGAGLRISMASLGAGLSAGDVTALQARGCAYLTAINGTCVTPQAFASITPSSCTFSPGTRNGPVCAMGVTMSPASPASTAALTLTGANSGNFHLIGSGCSNLSNLSYSNPPSGPALTTGDGTWTWGAAASGRPGEYNINLSGTPVGVGLYMQVTGGQLYVNTTSSGWFVYNGGTFISTPAPSQPDGCIIEQNSAAGGTPAGTYTDVSVVATQAGISNSPKTQPLTLIGTSPSETPAPAIAAGFNVLAVDYDFTQSNPWSNRNSWLRCHDGTGAATPLLYQDWGGFGSFPFAPCSDISQATDPFGSPALHIYTDHAYLSSLGCEPHCSGIIYWQVLQNTDSSGNGNRLPTNLYVEVTALTRSSDPSMANVESDFWSNSNISSIEWDGIEWFGSTIGGSTYHNNVTGNVFSTNTHDVLDQSAYHKYAWRVTSNGTNDGYFCIYKDDAPSGPSPGNCQNWNPSAAQAANENNGNVLFEVGYAGCGDNGIFCPNSSIEQWVKRLRVWSCAGINSGATCHSSTANP